MNVTRKDLESAAIHIPGFISLCLAALVIGFEFVRSFPDASHPLLDLGSFIESARAGRAGLNPYDMYPLSLRGWLHGVEFLNKNLNPPISVLFFQLFTFANPEVVFRRWYLIQGIFYLLYCLWLSRQFPQVSRLTSLLWMGALTAFWDTMDLGQIYVPLFALAGVAWVMLQRGNYWIAGVCIGTIVAFKPQFVIVSLFLMLGRFFLPAMVSLATTAALSVIPLFIYGQTVYLQWFRVLEDVRIRIPLQTNVSLPGLFDRVGLFSFGIGAGIALCALTAIWIVLRRPDILKVITFAFLITLLVSPLAWVHYSLVLVPVYLSNWRNEAFHLPAYLLIVPAGWAIASGQSSPLHFFTLGSLYTWALVMTLGLLIGNEIKEIREDSSSACAPV